MLGQVRPCSEDEGDLKMARKTEHFRFSFSLYDSCNCLLGAAASGANKNRSNISERKEKEET